MFFFLAKPCHKNYLKFGCYNYKRKIYIFFNSIQIITYSNIIVSLVLKKSKWYALIDMSRFLQTHKNEGVFQFGECALILQALVTHALAAQLDLHFIISHCFGAHT